MVETLAFIVFKEVFKLSVFDVRTGTDSLRFKLVVVGWDYWWFSLSKTCNLGILHFRRIIEAG